MKNAYIPSLIVMLLAGIFFLVFPVGTLTAAVRVLGIVLILAGILGVGGEIAKKVDKSDLKLLCYAAAVIAGIIVLVSPSFVLNAFPFIVGLIILILGILDVVRAIQILLETVDGWKMEVVLAALTVIAGIILMINPFGTLKILARVFGLVLIYHAVIGIRMSQRLPET